MVSKVKTLAQLEEIKNRVRPSIEIREHAEAGTRVLVGMATCGIAAGAREVLGAFVEEIATKALADVMVTQTGCIGRCQNEPVVEIVSPGKDRVTYGGVTPELAKRIVSEHLIDGNIVAEALI